MRAVRICKHRRPWVTIRIFSTLALSGSRIDAQIRVSEMISGLFSVLQDVVCARVVSIKLTPYQSMGADGAL